MSIFDSINPAKMALMAGIGLIGIGIAVAKQVMGDDEEDLDKFGPDYDSRFFEAYARGFRETKDLDW
ncbi:MAG: hypothetical protein IPH08_11125 [Rhodocyclaceae bacterium]|nr:hypothetical protein [Rhodocyclaceae bacterium]